MPDIIPWTDALKKSKRCFALSARCGCVRASLGSYHLQIFSSWSYVRFPKIFGRDGIVVARRRRIKKCYKWDCAGIGCWTHTRASLLNLRAANDWRAFTPLELDHPVIPNTILFLLSYQIWQLYLYDMLCEAGPFLRLQAIHWLSAFHLFFFGESLVLLESPTYQL